MEPRPPGATAGPQAAPDGRKSTPAEHLRPADHRRERSRLAALLERNLQPGRTRRPPRSYPRKGVARFSRTEINGDCLGIVDPDFSNCRNTRPLAGPEPTFKDCNRRSLPVSHYHDDFRLLRWNLTCKHKPPIDLALPRPRNPDPCDCRSIACPDLPSNPSILVKVVTLDLRISKPTPPANAVVPLDADSCTREPEFLYRIRWSAALHQSAHHTFAGFRGSAFGASKVYAVAGRVGSWDTTLLTL